MKFKKLVLLLLFFFGWISVMSMSNVDISKFPGHFQQLFEKIEIDKLGNNVVEYKVQQIDRHTLYVSFSVNLKNDVQQDDWSVIIKPGFKSTFNWAPHLTPTDNHVIDQHVFRSPSIIFTNNQVGFAIIPDISKIKNGENRWFMDMNANENYLELGIGKNKVTDHVLFERTSGALFKKGSIEYGFYILGYFNNEDIQNPFRKPIDFFWKKWGHGYYKSTRLKNREYESYIQHTYRWAFETWKDVVWQEFVLNGKKVGAPTLIVNMTQSPNYKGVINEREFRSIWNQAWFSSLRSAGGLYRYARRTNNKDLMRKANMTKELALQSPMKNGFFYNVIGTESQTLKIENEYVNRSKGWDSYFWGNSNRNPYTWDFRKSPFHILDMSWTAGLMLDWYEELDADSELLLYTEKYANALLKKQYKDGFFPGWLSLDSLKPMDYLNDSPESAMSVTFLLKLYEITKNKEYKDAALKAMEAIISQIIPVGRWEDFETYWSCCRYGTTDLVGRKVERNNMHKQCNFSMYWTAEALLRCYKSTKDVRYLKFGQRTLDEMLMTQSIWQPPYMYVKVFGGFGVMNSDAEWNDSRESLFSELILEYGCTLGLKEYKERAMAALAASFSMMYCPENPDAKQQWEKVWTFFNEKDYGFTMENYGHGGRTSLEGEGMGEFTIYDWGNGAAAEAYNRILDRYGEKVFE